MNSLSDLLAKADTEQGFYSLFRDLYEEFDKNAYSDDILFDLSDTSEEYFAYTKVELSRSLIEFIEREVLSGVARPWPVTSHELALIANRILRCACLHRDVFAMYYVQFRAEVHVAVDRSEDVLGSSLEKHVVPVFVYGKNYILSREDGPHSRAVLDVAHGTEILFHTEVARDRPFRIVMEFRAGHVSAAAERALVRTLRREACRAATILFSSGHFLPEPQLWVSPFGELKRMIIESSGGRAPYESDSSVSPTIVSPRLTHTFVSSVWPNGADGLQSLVRFLKSSALLGFPGVGIDIKINTATSLAVRALQSADTNVKLLMACAAIEAVVCHKVDPRDVSSDEGGPTKQFIRGVLALVGEVPKAEGGIDKKHLDALYDQRSKIAHGDDDGCADVDSANLACVLACQCIVQLQAFRAWWVLTSDGHVPTAVEFRQALREAKAGRSGVPWLLKLNPPRLVAAWLYSHERAWSRASRRHEIIPPLSGGSRWRWAGPPRFL